VDPRSIPFYPKHGIETPSLNSGSEPFLDDIELSFGKAQGEAAAVSTEALIYDLGASVSETSQFAAADGGSVQFSNYSSISFGIQDSQDSSFGVQESQRVSFLESNTKFDAPSPNQQVKPEASDYTHSQSPCSQSLTSSGFATTSSSIFTAIPAQDQPVILNCPQCPRIFKKRYDMEQHTRNYRHTYQCTMADCNWSFHLPKDQARHVLTHCQARPEFFCFSPRCEYSEALRARSFHRRDLRDRHVRVVHGLPSRSNCHP